jgi:hypothetical protein|tara:strand:+ start:1898 stop:2164 length:267 start_codon:yes stop_codon:yes gene_type:complete
MFDNNFEELDKKYSATYEAEKRFTEPYNSTGRTVPNYVGLSFSSHLDQLEYNQYKMMRESNMEAKKKLVEVCPHCGENPNEPKERSWT